jgi:hypothetical protein
LIVDPESKSVRITTVLVLGKLSEFVDSEDKSTIVSDIFFICNDL